MTTPQNPGPSPDPQSLKSQSLTGSAFAAPAYINTGRSEAKSKTEEEWRRELTPEEYRVLRQAGTERAYTGEYWDTHTEGVYQCRACGTELFTSNEKFDSHCGWPSFWAPLAEGKVRYIHDRSLGMDRIEVRCGTCDSHLGHVFEGEGYGTPTDQRYCINSVSLRLIEATPQRQGEAGDAPGGGSA